MNVQREASEAYRRIGRAAFERYLLDLLRRYAAEEERQKREIFHKEPRLEVRSIEMLGEFPRTTYKFVYVHLRRDEERTESFMLYGNPECFDEKGELLVTGDYIAGEMLRLLRESK
jgi:hypothetical protein